MEESEDNIFQENSKKGDSFITVKIKPKKRSLLERELETNLTARITSPVTIGESTSTSRYGRARRLKTDTEISDSRKIMIDVLKSTQEKSPIKVQSPVYKMHASNSPIKVTQSPVEVFLDNQIESIYQENKSLSRFSKEETVRTSPNLKSQKVYVQKDLIQTREPEETLLLIKNIFSPVKSNRKSNTHLSNVLERSSDKFSLSSDNLQNSLIDNSKVVKTLDFDSKKKKRDNKEMKVLSKSELFDLEAKCMYQVGDLAWSRMGTFPFWPCIVTRDPANGMFVKKKLFGRIERDIIHVTFFGDNGRRGWILDSMLRKFSGLAEFESTRDKFTTEEKKKDPRLYAAFFISEKKQALWLTSIKEAETLLREPKRLRIDLLNDLLAKSRSFKITPKSQKSGKVTRTDSDVSLSESLYDTLFSEDDGKTEDSERSKNKSRNKSLDVSEVVTACLDNMAAKTGITKIQRQSHMDIWLQKAKSKTPEKTQVKKLVLKKVVANKVCTSKKKNFNLTTRKPYSLRKYPYESQHLLAHHNEHDYSKCISEDDTISIQTNSSNSENKHELVPLGESGADVGVIPKVESLAINKSESYLVTKSDNFIVTRSKFTKENVIENGVKTLSKLEIHNMKSDRVSLVQDEDIDINLESNIKYQLSKDELYEDDENSLSDTNCSQTDSMFSFDSCLEYSASQNESENSESFKEATNDIQNDVLNGLTNGGSLLNSDCININTNTVTDVDSEVSSDYENNYKLENSVNIITDKSSNEFEEVNKEFEQIVSSDSDSVHENSNTLKSDDNLDFSVSLLQHNEPEDDNNKEWTDSVNNEIKTTFLDNTKTSPVNHLEDIDTIDSKFLSDETRINSYLISKPSLDVSNKKYFFYNMHVNSTDIFESEDDHYGDSNSSDKIKTEDLEKILVSKASSGITINNCVNEMLDKNGSTLPESENNHFNYSTGDKINNETFEKIYVENERSNNTNCSVDKNNIKILETLKNNTEQITLEQSEICSASTVQNTTTLEKSDMTDNCAIYFREKNLVDSAESVDNNVLGTDVCVQRPEKMSTVDDINCDKTEKIRNEFPIMNGFHETEIENIDSDENDLETTSLNSESEEKSEIKTGMDNNKRKYKEFDNPEFLKYYQLRQDTFIDEHPELSDDEIKNFLHRSWLYQNSKKSDIMKVDNIEQSCLVKGLNEPIYTKAFRNLKKSNRKIKKKGVIEDNNSDTESVSSQSSQITIKSDTSLRSPIVLLKRDLSLAHYGFKSSPKIFNSDNNVTENQIRKIDTDISLTTTEEVITMNEDIPLCQDLIEIETEIQCISPISRDGPFVKDKMQQKTLELCSDLITDNMKSVKKINDDNCEVKKELDLDNDNTSINSESSDVPLTRRNLRLRTKESDLSDNKSLDVSKEETESNNESYNSEVSETNIVPKLKIKVKNENKMAKKLNDPEFKKYQELKQDALMDENPHLNQEEVTNYLYKTWLYEENLKSDLKRVDEIPISSLVKGLEQEKEPIKKTKKKHKVPTEITDYFDVSPREKTKRKSVRPYYNEEYTDIEDEIESYDINTNNDCKLTGDINIEQGGDLQNNTEELCDETVIDDFEHYFAELTKPKPNIFKGLLREKVCEICEKTGNLVKCKTCHGMFHVDCVQMKDKVTEVSTPVRGRKKKKKLGRKPKNVEDSEGNSDDKQDMSEDNNISIEEIELQSITVDAETLEKQLYEKMKELLENLDPVNYDSYSSDNEIDWNNTVPGECEIVDVKLKRKSCDSYTNFKCKSCTKNEIPVCFVCKNVVSKKESSVRQKCNVAHCNKYYHIECLDHWPQTQFNSGEPSKNNKKINQHFEALSCPRHVCHTCVSDDPRGCKTRFSSDKLARCIRCPATYHTFTKCVPAGSQILTASHIICPRHYQHRPGKVPCHVNTGWCFICALGGTLICCEYCPTSFHAECLNIDPPEGGYMCEDCETGRLPLYGEMVWVKLGHYRWWPGLILHPSEIPRNIMAVNHRLGEFVVRFFGQYDYYWVNRGRVFPFQEGDTGRVSSQRSKIDEAFTMAIEHAQRACEVLKSAQSNDEESIDIASSLLPPHYVKLKVNKPCGSLCGRKLDDPESSLTQCECNPDEEDPCGPYSQCLNRMLLTECGRSCRAGDRCNNRAFEKRLYPKLVPYRTPHRGWGLKTLENIKAGQFVIEYVGELIDEEEFKRRMRRKHEIRDENFYFLTLDKERMIDAGPKGNLARFMNHCCEPNCETQKWTVLGDVRVGLFAMKDIPANSEVTFNYNLESAGIEKKRCMCGAKRCSGYIGAKPKQEEPQTKKPKLQPPTKKTYKRRKIEVSPTGSKTKAKKLGRPPKPKELTEIEKDLLIIRSATNGLSSDESTFSSEGDRPKTLKRKRLSMSSEDIGFNQDLDNKRQRCYD